MHYRKLVQRAGLTVATAALVATATPASAMPDRGLHVPSVVLFAVDANGTACRSEVYAFSDVRPTTNLVAEIGRLEVTTTPSTCRIT